jgi:integrase
MAIKFCLEWSCESCGKEVKLDLDKLGKPDLCRHVILMKEIFDRYELEIIPLKRTRTQQDYRYYLDFLRKTFDLVPINDLKPPMIAAYRDGRGAKVRANRELAVLSSIFNHAREWGLTDRPNPIKGVRKHKEKPRSYYAQDDVFQAVYNMACQELRDAMDLAYLTAQRPGDIMKMRVHDVINGALEVQQSKTEKKLRILLDLPNGERAELGKVIDRILSSKTERVYLVESEQGKPFTQVMLKKRWHKARDAAITFSKDAGLSDRIAKFQFRDIRPKAASDSIDLETARKLLGHTKQQITETVYRRVGETVSPLK